MRKTFVSLVTLLSLMLTAMPSQAAIGANAARTAPIAFEDGDAHFIPLSNDGATSIDFSTSGANQKVVISYNAECAVAGTDNATWLDIDILVDGVAAAPSNNDNAFCTDHGNGLLRNWVSAITMVVVNVPSAGPHTVQVRGTLRNFNDGDSWRLDDSTLLVSR